MAPGASCPQAPSLPSSLCASLPPRIEGNKREERGERWITGEKALE